MTNKIGIAVLFFGVLFSACNHSVNQFEIENNETTGADRQMESWFWSRAYPDPQSINDKYASGWQGAKELESFTRSLVVNNAQLKEEVGNYASGLGNWVSLWNENTIGGRTLSIAINPQNSNQILIGTAGGGLWSSSNAGANWNKVVTGLPIEGVPSVIINPTKPNIIYAGTGEVYRVDTTGIGYNVWKTRGSYGVGIIKSSDGGKTWNQIFTKKQSQMFGVQELVFDPANPDIIYACTTDGLYRSADAGVTWKRILNKIYTRQIVINPANRKEMIVSVGNLVNPDKGLYKTKDAGQTWTKISSSAFPAVFNGLISITNKGNRVYAGFGTNGLTSSNELVLSDNFGESWVLKTNSNICYYQYWYCNDIAIDPSNIDRVITTGVNVNAYTSTSTTTSAGIRKAINNIHSDVHDVIYDPNNPQVVYLATDGGMYKSTNNGTSFNRINNGLYAVQIYAPIGVSPSDPNIIVVGLQDNGVHRYNGIKWSTVLGSDGGPSVFNKQNRNIALSSTQNCVIYRSTNEGKNFTNILSGWPGDRTAFMAPLGISNSNSNYVYCATDLWHPSADGGLTFSNYDQTLTNYIEARNKTAIAIGVSPINSQKAYVSTSPFSQRSDNSLNVNPPPNLFKTLNAGVANATFKNIKNNLPDRFVLDFAFSKTNDDSVFITLGGFGSQHIYVTGNGGASWQPVGKGLPDVPFNAIVFDPINPQVIYAGCDLGVFVSNNRGQSWLDFNTGFWDATQVYDLQISADNKLLCATHGKGIFKSDLFSTKSLPVNISSFVGVQKNTYNELIWIADRENNLKLYEVEKSTDAINFNKINTVKSNAAKKYILNDNIKANASNVFYYRLKFINKDGSYTYSAITEVQNTNSTFYSIASNPFRDRITIKFSALGKHTINTSLYNAAGKLVNKSAEQMINGASNFQLNNLSGLANGVYFLDILIDGKRYTEKLIKD